MRIAIDEVAERMPPPGPLVLAGLGAVGEDPHPTQVVGPTRELSLFDQDRPDGPPAASRPARYAQVARVPRRTRSAAPFLLGAVITVLIAAAAFVLARPNVGPSVTVPLLVGQSRGAAEQTALDAKLLIDPTTRASDDPAGTVIAQDPAPGAFLAERTSVHVVLSRGPAPIKLPVLAGTTQDAATQALQGQFAVRVVERPSDKVPKGSVITSDPLNTAAPDSVVTIYVSTGPPLVVVPDVHGRSYASAVQRLANRRFGASRQDEFNDAPAGQVLGTQPLAGDRAPCGSTVTVRVSKGPDLVDVPDFTNMTIEQATAAAAAAGVQVQAQGVLGAGRKVRAQAPQAADGKVKRNTVITLFF